MKTVLKYIKILLLVVCFILCEKVCITNIETKSSNSNLNKTLDLHAMAMKIDEIQKNDLYSPLDTYNGILTGYVANCPLCGGTLSCTGVNVTDGTTTYNDNTYGSVNIVASSLSLPCGSIVQFDLNNDSITAIVLDRGVTGTSLDLLVDSEAKAVTTVGSKYISYNILRYGYTRE